MPENAPSAAPLPRPGPAPRRAWMRALIAAGLLAAGTAAILTPWGQRAGRAVSRRLFPPERTAPPRPEPPRIVTKERILEKRVEVPVMLPPPALPSGPTLGPREGDLTTLFSGISFKSKFLSTQGSTATVERSTADAYVVEMSVKVRLPKPASTMDQLRSLNPELGNLLPGLAPLINQGKVSGFFHYLYDLKAKAIEKNLKRLDRMPSRHNFYDLDAMLELEHPVSKQKVLLMQADMDVVSDGSDGDRMPVFDDAILKSAFFQPSTSYGWAKRTPQVNPVVPKLEEELREVREKLKESKQSKEEKNILTARAGEIPRIVADLKKRSYLIGQEDPFIVIPSSLRSYQGRNDWSPSIGDYAVVLYGGLLLPAVVGDYGPTTKVGEASLRIARQIDSAASPYRRPVSDLKVTYLIFPDSADAERKAPDYAAWRRRCESLVAGIGGSGVPLHEWEDRLKPQPPPSVPATPSAAPEAGTDAAIPAALPPAKTSP